MYVFNAAVAVSLSISVLGAASAAGGITLKKIVFPTALDGTAGPFVPPTFVPLSQAIVFQFSGKPKFPSVFEAALRITVDASNNQGQPVGQQAFGDFEIDGDRVIFRPRLPTDPLPPDFSPQTDIASDLGLPGLLPGTVYRISVPIDVPGAIGNLTKSKVALPIFFMTSPVVGGPLFLSTLFSNAPQTPPKVEKKKTKPKPGIDGLYPNPFSDPAGLFDSIPVAKRPPFRLRFDAPVDPQSDNISSSRVRVRVILDASGAPVDLPVPSEPILTSNSPSGATVASYPLSILPFGATIAVEVSDLFRSLVGVTVNDGSSPESFLEIARYRVATDPQPGEPIDDAVFEDFDDSLTADPSISSEGLILASWDAADSDTLKASLGFGGDGSLGRFEPSNFPNVINLDTDFQVFPLFSGATPDVAAGTVVTGGQFHFTDFHLPPNVTLRARGQNPLVITCTGECLIEGLVDLNGADGSGDNTFDSAITPVPGGTGGPGGGKGGDGHPVKTPSGGSLQFMQTPQFGESGSGPKIGAGGSSPSGAGGGGGGQCGATLPWPFQSSICADAFTNADGSRASGGGGGSFNVFLPNAGAAQTAGIGPEPNGILVSGRRGAIGIGDHLPVTFDPGAPIPAEPECYQATEGNPTNAVARPNPNLTFAQAKSQDLDGNGHSDLIYDQPPLLNIATPWATAKRVTLFGDAGPMVFKDADPDNDFVGQGGELPDVRGGQGGGGGGSRTEGLSQICKPVIFDQLQFPLTVLDSRGAGGGGAGGGAKFVAIGKLELRGSKAKILARGGRGGGAEEIETSSRGGSGGGGSGGCVILQSATTVILNDPALPTPYAIDVSPGFAHDASTLLSSATVGTPGGEPRTLQVGDSGPGGPGIVQIHSPDVTQVNTAKIGADVNYSMFNIGSGGGINDGLDPMNPLVPFAKTPTPLGSKSTARSTWYDFKFVTRGFRPPIATSAGALAGPIFGVQGEGAFFHGIDIATGLVLTDAAGNVLTPFENDFAVDSPDLAKSDFIPNGPVDFQSVQVEFQAADEDAANPGLPDLATSTEWVSDTTLLNGRRFVRWQITFDIATNPTVGVSAATPRPTVDFLRIPFRY